MKKLFLLLIPVLFILSCNKDADLPLHTIAGVAPLTGPFNTSVTITGTGFISGSSENKVFFNGKQATVNSSTTTELVVLVPVFAETGPVEVIIDGRTVTGPIFNFEYSFTVSTVAGIPGAGDIQDGTPANAKFYSPNGLDLDDAGNVIIADFRALRKMTSDGVVTTIAGANADGDLDGVGSAARFNGLRHVVVLENGTYVTTEENNHKLRKITLGGSVTTWIDNGYGYMDGDASTAAFAYPEGVTEDEAGNLYVTEWANYTIRKITPSGNVTTFAGDQTNPGGADGTGTDARFSNLVGITTLANGNMLATEIGTHRIRLITPGAMVTTLAGSGSAGYADGQGTSAIFDDPLSICEGHDGAYYVVDRNNTKIRRVGTGGHTTTFTGGAAGYADGSLSEALFNSPFGIVYDSDKHCYYIGDAGNKLIRKILVE